MAPRRQAKQAAAESVVVAAEGDVTPPKKRKTTAKSATAEPKQAKSRSRQAKANKQENEVSKPASAKKSRTRQKNDADSSASTATTAAKNDTKSKSKKQIKEKDDTAENNAEVAEKRIRGDKAATVMKKAAIKKMTQTKSKAPTKVPTVRKQTKMTAENSIGDTETTKNVYNKNPVKRTTRHMKIVEENDAPAQLTVKVPRKRKNMEDKNEIIAETQTTKEREENEGKASKKLRGRQKKVETADAITVTSKERSKKNSVEEIIKSPLKKTIRKKQNSKEQNAAIQEDNPKIKAVKNVKKRNAKTAAPRKKFNAVTDDQTEKTEANEMKETMPEMYITENGEAHIAEHKQKKRNVGKTNTVTRKIETKGKQKKGQVITASVDEKETIQDVIAENETIETNVALEIDGNGTKDVPSNEYNSLLENEKEKNHSKADAIKDELVTEKSIDETERAANFVCI